MSVLSSRLFQQFVPSMIEREQYLAMVDNRLTYIGHQINEKSVLAAKAKSGVVVHIQRDGTIFDGSEEECDF